MSSPAPADPAPDSNPPAATREEPGATREEPGPAAIPPPPATATPPPAAEAEGDSGLLPPAHWTELAQRQEEQDDNDSAFGDAASSTDSINSSILEYRTIHGRTYHSATVPGDGDAQYWGSNDNKQNESMDIKSVPLLLSACVP